MVSQRAISARLACFKRRIVNTFVPYDDPAECARVLDRQRLGKQRVEVLQLLRALFGHTKGWYNHPAARMWRGYEGALANYGVVICREWVRRGYKDTCVGKITLMIEPDTHWPPWWGDLLVHRSHRSNLIRKDPGHYQAFWPDVPSDLPYVWPVS